MIANINKQYYDIVHSIHHTRYDDGVSRTGLRCKTIPSAMITHDMSQGFPLISLKRTPLRLIAVELEAFIKGITSKKWFQDRNCHIWDEWCNPQKVPYGHDADTLRKMAEEDDLGPIYGFNWNNFGGWYRPHPNIHTPFDKKIELDFSSDKARLIGQKFSFGYGEYHVIKEYYVGKHLRYDVKFTDTGAVYTNVTKQNILSGAIADYWYAAVSKVGCLGDIHTARKNIFYNKLKPTWEAMIHRCYNSSDRCYNLYGGKGVYVVDKWLIFSNFLEDVINLPNFNKKLQDWSNYTLDKDFSGLGYYGPDSCVWLTKKEQTVFSTQTDKLLNMHLYRKGYNQLTHIINTLTTNPSDRRMICSAWNPLALDHQALPPCHVLFQVSVINNKLNLTWFQRSCDILLGIPFNIASYGLLLHLFAKYYGFEEGTLTGFLNNVHIYENQNEGAVKLLSRNPNTFALPTVSTDLDANDHDLREWEYTKTALHDYACFPAIKMPVAV